MAKSDERIDSRFLRDRPTNYGDPKWKAFDDLPQFGGQDGEGMPRMSPNGRGYDDLVWVDSDGDNQFDFGEFFDYDQAIRSEGDSIYQGQKINEARDLDYREDMFGRDPLGRVRAEPGTDNQQLALNYQRYGEGEELPSGHGTTFMGQPALQDSPEDGGFYNEWIKRPFMNYLAAPAAGTAGYLADLATGKSGERTDNTSNRLADAAFSLPPAKAAASAVKGGFIGAKQLAQQSSKSKGLQQNVGKTFKGEVDKPWTHGYTKAGKRAPYRSRNVKQTISQHPNTPFGKNVKNTLDKIGLPTQLPKAKQFIGGSTTPLGRNATSTTKFLGNLGGKMGGGLQKYQTPILFGGIGGASLMEENGLVPEEYKEFMDAPDMFADDMGISFGDKLDNINQIDLNLANEMPGLTEEETQNLGQALQLSRERADASTEPGARGDKGDRGAPGTTSTFKNALNTPLDNPLDNPYTAPPSREPLDPNSQASQDARRFPSIPRPSGDMKNPNDPGPSLDGLQNRLNMPKRPSQKDLNPNIKPVPMPGVPDPESDESPWSKAPPMQAQPAPLPTEAEKHAMEMKKADPMYQQLMNDSDDFRQLLATDHPVSRRPIKRPTYLDKPDRTIHYKGGVKEVIPGKKFMGGRWDPYTSIRNAAAEQRRNSDLGAKAKIQERLLQERLGGQGPRGAEGEAGPVGLDDAVNEATKAERQAYFKTHSLEEPSDPMEQRKFAQWYNTHGKRNDQNNRWSDSEPYPKFDPYLA